MGSRVSFAPSRPSQKSSAVPGVFCAMIFCDITCFIKAKAPTPFTRVNPIRTIFVEPHYYQNCNRCFVNLRAFRRTREKWDASKANGDNGKCRVSVPEKCQPCKFSEGSLLFILRQIQYSFSILRSNLCLRLLSHERLKAAFRTKTWTARLRFFPDKKNFLKHRQMTWPKPCN